MVEFGPYRLEELLGRGGMGEVFRAHDLRHDRTVAVKRLAPHLADELDFQQRFRREAHLVAQLRNPHVVTIHSYGDIDGQLYIDMQYVSGGDLLGLIERSAPLAPERAVGILEQVASALDEAHDSGLVHRDVKPSNVLLDGKLADFCYLADWGITRVTTTRRSNSLTRTGALIGSLTYMAPEQFDGAVTMRSDIYALTCVFFEMITGRRPYAGDGLPVLMHAHMQVPPPRPSEVAVESAMFDEIIATGMAKEAGSRYSTAGELAGAARRALDAATRRRAATEPDDARADAARAGAVPRETVRPAEAGAITAPIPDRAAPSLRSSDVEVAPSGATEGLRPAGHGPVDRGAGRDRWLLPAVAALLVVAVLVGVGVSISTAGASRNAQAPQEPVVVTSTAAVPSSTPPPAGPVLGEAIFTGRTADGDLTLAIGFKDGRAAGYLCDGDQVEAWLEGGVDGDRLVLQGPSADTAVDAVADQFGLQGTVTVQGVRQRFSAQIATAAAGLYENRRSVEGIATRIGWIVLSTGEVVGVVRRGDVRSAAPQLDVATLTAVDGGEVIRAERLAGDSEVIG
jgi:serine/threonine-protein kinase